MRNGYGHRRWGVERIVAVVVGGLAMAAVLGLGLGWLVQYLWNVTVVKLFAFPAITYWQAVGLFVLAKLFFGGMGLHGNGHHHRRRGPWGARGMGYERCGGRHEMFDRFWEEEGEKAFDAYLERVRSEGREPKEPGN
ncbi:MAG: hypothetical protein LAO05_14305 [Acidobacteriia bacterium]|nr:hypothetical protein [Terriglobia bacterium]